MALLFLTGSAVSFAQSGFAAELTNVPANYEIRRVAGGIFALSISTPKTNYSRGEPIDINVSIENTGTSNFVDYSSINTRMDYGACVMFTNGEVFFENDPEVGVGSGMFLNLKPGEKHTNSVSYSLQISWPGIYRIKLTRHAWSPEAGREKIYSNEIIVQITQDRFKP